MITTEPPSSRDNKMQRIHNRSIFIQKTKLTEVTVSQEELDGRDRQLGDVTEAGRRDDVDCPLVSPDALPVKLDHHILEMMQVVEVH